MFSTICLYFMFLFSLSYGNTYRSYSKNIYIKPEDSVVIQSVNYPAHVPSNLRQTWIFRTEPGAIIVLNCDDIRLIQDRPCGENVFLISGPNKVEEICGARFDYSYESEVNILAARFRTGSKGLGMMQCRVSAQYKINITTENTVYASLNFDSEEIESSEHGGPKGRKKTTCNCGWVNRKVGRVFGGKETHTNEFPFVAGLVIRDTRKPFCGAAIITSNHLISAAHCLYGYTFIGGYSIVIGEHDLETSGETSFTEYIPIKKYILHEKYNNKNHVNDIALLVLEKEITFSKWIGPACMPNGPIPLDNEFIKTIGWGRTPTDPIGSPVLQKVNLKVLNKSSCAALNSGFVSEESSNQLCTYGKGKSACSGDSGGPLVWVDPETNRFTLIGIVSYERSDCSIPLPRIATDVTTYVDWIKEKINENDMRNTCSKVS